LLVSPSLFCGYREEEVGPGVGLAFERRTRIAAGEAFLYLLPFFHGCMDDGGDVDVDGLHMEGREGCLSHGFREVVGGVGVVVLSKNTVSCCALSPSSMSLSLFLSSSSLIPLFLASFLPFPLSLPLSELSPYRKHRDTTFFSDTNDSVDSVDVGKQAQVVLQIRLRREGPLRVRNPSRKTLHSAITLATLTSFSPSNFKVCV